MARNLRAFPRSQMRDVRSLPPAEVAIASVLAAGLWALQTRSWRRTELHVKNRDDRPGLEARVERLDLASARLLVDDVDLVKETCADEHGALVALAQRTRIRDTACIGLDLKALGCLEIRSG